MNNTFSKNERLNKKILIGKLFEGGASKSFSVFPIRVVYLPIEQAELNKAQVLISVSKRHFKKAVDRNFIKRQIREAYRTNKQELNELLLNKEENLTIAFIYTSNKFFDSKEINKKIKVALKRIGEQVK